MGGVERERRGSKRSGKEREEETERRDNIAEMKGGLERIKLFSKRSGVDPFGNWEVSVKGGYILKIIEAEIAFKV